MRNYRNVASNGSYPNTLGSGKTQGTKIQSSFLIDIQPINDKVPSYTTISNGTIFFLGFISNEQNLPAGLEYLLKINFSRQRHTDLIPKYFQTVVMKKNVGVGEVFTFPTSARGTILLCAPSTYIDAFSYRKKLAELDGTMNFAKEAGLTGYAMMNCISLASTLAFKQPAPADLTEMFTNEPNYGHTLVYSHIGNFNFNLNQTTGGEFPVALTRLNFVKDAGTDQKIIEDIGVSIERTTNLDFNTNRNNSITSIVNGSIVFVGAYRQPDPFPLTGFTILKEQTISCGGLVQTYFIAMKDVVKGEVIPYKSTGRFGGTFYETFSKLSTKSYVTGNPAKGATEFTQRNPNPLKTIFGIIGGVVASGQGTSVELSSNATYLTSYRPTSNYWNGFVGCDFLADFQPDIRISYTEGTYLGEKDTVIGMYVEF